MYLHNIPSHFKEVDAEQFEAFLKTCPDYYRDLFNYAVYHFRHNNKPFAYVSRNPERVFVDPSLLQEAA